MKTTRRQGSLYLLIARWFSERRVIWTLDSISAGWAFNAWDLKHTKGGGGVLCSIRFDEPVRDIYSQQEPVFISPKEKRKEVKKRKLTLDEYHTMRKCTTILLVQLTSLFAESSRHRKHTGVAYNKMVLTLCLERGNRWKKKDSTLETTRSRRDTFGANWRRKGSSRVNLGTPFEECSLTV